METKLNAANRIQHVKARHVLSKNKTAAMAFKSLSFIPGIVKDKGFMAELKKLGDAEPPEMGEVDCVKTHLAPAYFDRLEELGVEVQVIDAVGPEHFRLKIRLP